jgi:ABC-type antimicrobial peptide transport system permease subunit
MRSRDLFHISLQNLKNQKSRIFFPIIGVSIGIGAILFFVSFGYGLQKNLLEKITTEESLLTLDIVSPESGIVAINNQTLEKISQIRTVERVSPQAIFSAQASLEDLNSETIINIINPDMFVLAGISADSGRVFTEQDSQKVVVNSSVLELFDLNPEQILGRKLSFLVFLPTGDGSIEVEPLKIEKEFEVIGVINETGSPSQIFMKRSDVPEISINEYQFAKIKVINDKTMEQVRGNLIEMGFSVSALSDTISQANQIFRVIQIILAVFGVVSLIVAAIGLINMMTITLLERTNEIGIMRSLGASPQIIKKLFLGESLIIGFIGGLLGIGIGVLSAELFNGLLNIIANNFGGQSVDLFVYPTWFIIFIILLSSTVGLISGFFPAKRASNLNPLEALRYK